MAYNDIIDTIADQYDDELNNPERKWLFKCITAHEGPLSTKHPNYNRSKYNLLVQWEDGSVMREPLGIRFRRLVKDDKTFKRLVNQAWLKSIRRSMVYKYGFEVAQSHAHAMQLHA